MRKLLKYEFKSVFYLLLPLYACFMVVSVACRLFMNIEFLQDIFNGVPFFFLRYSSSCPLCSFHWSP